MWSEMPITCVSMTTVLSDSHWWTSLELKIILLIFCSLVCKNERWIERCQRETAHILAFSFLDRILLSFFSLSLFLFVIDNSSLGVPKRLIFLWGNIWYVGGFRDSCERVFDGKCLVEVYFFLLVSQCSTCSPWRDKNWHCI